MSYASLDQGKLEEKNQDPRDEKGVCLPETDRLTLWFIEMVYPRIYADCMQKIKGLNQEIIKIYIR